jgi:hypothetical protein
MTKNLQLGKFETCYRRLSQGAPCSWKPNSPIFHLLPISQHGSSHWIQHEANKIAGNTHVSRQCCHMIGPNWKVKSCFAWVWARQNNLLYNKKIKTVNNEYNYKTSTNATRHHESNLQIQLGYLNETQISIINIQQFCNTSHYNNNQHDVCTCNFAVQLVISNWKKEQYS